MRTFLGIALALGVALSGCGGGSGSDSNSVVFQGTLTERAGHKAAEGDVTLKHAAGARIGEVKICIKEQCSITDDEGQFGLFDDAFEGGTFTISLDGHGIKTTVDASLPKGVREVMMELGHAKNVVKVEKLMADGVDHTGHEHSH